jgi:uncharacterized lipoprotein YehR (DUF1307 family)
MKNITRILAILSALVLLVSLVSCGDKSGAIKKAFEEDGWTVTTVNTENSTAKTVLSLFLTEEQIEDAAEYEIIWCNKSIVKNAVVIKFPSSGDIKTFLTVEDSEGKKDTKAYDEAKANGMINGNCLLVTADSDAKELFK